MLKNEVYDSIMNRIKMLNNCVYDSIMNRIKMLKIECMTAL